MDFIKYYFIVLITTLSLTEDVSSITLTATSSPAKAVLGQNRFELSCSYQLGSDEQFISMTLSRKRSSENLFSNIVSFPGPSLAVNASYLNGSANLVNRTTASKPTVSSQTAKLVYNEIQCEDKADYRWEATYYRVETLTISKDFTFDIQVNNRFEENDNELSFQPNINIAEDDQIVFTCKGDVGNEPAGQLTWFYYLNNDTDVDIDVSTSAVPQSPVYNPSTCSNSRQSTLRLTMTKEFNNILVRCTVAQFNFNEFGDGYIQTTNIPVSYSPRIETIEKNPDSLSYLEGLESLTLKCNADANPPAEYHWVLPDNSTVEAQSMTLSNLTVDDSGSYTCMANNMFLTSNHTAQQSVVLNIRPVPTPTTTTEPSSSATTQQPGTTISPARQGQDDDKTTTIIIIVVVVVVVIIIVIIVVLVYIKMKKKPKEIEEPPEKPRNNQGLFYGNRPDLVSADHNAKNNMGSGGLNSSFNNSFDSSSDTKPRNDDGLLYIDLQFDNKPGSRRPIQLVDNMGGGNTPYADIVNPRV